MAWITIKDHRNFLFVQRIGDTRLKLKINDLVTITVGSLSISGNKYSNKKRCQLDQFEVILAWIHVKCSDI